MNIPGDELYTLLNVALKKRGEETLQRTLYLALREAILSGRLRSGSQLSGSRTLARQLSLPAIPSMLRWTSSPSKGICSVIARERG